MDYSEIAPALDGSTFMKSRRVSLGDTSGGQLVVVGVPWESTKVSRLGCRFGPKAIREASYVSGYLLQSLQGSGLIDTATREVYVPATRHELVDAGDLGLYHADVHETMRTVCDGISRITRTGALPVILGGDHFISYPAIQGVVDGLAVAGRNETIGYVHVDAHMDLLDELPWFGKLSSGSQVRRLIDSGTLDPKRMLMIGIGGVLPKVEWDYADSVGIHRLCRHELQAAPDIRASVRAAVERVLTGCTAIYLTIDIDVNDRTFAPGTGAAGASGGLFPGQFLDVLAELRGLPLVGVDIVEVAPNLDPSGRTASLAATAISTVLEERLFDRQG